MPLAHIGLHEGGYRTIVILGSQPQHRACRWRERGVCFGRNLAETKLNSSPMPAVPCVFPMSNSLGQSRPHGSTQCSAPQFSPLGLESFETDMHSMPPQNRTNFGAFIEILITTCDRH